MQQTQYIVRGLFYTNFKNCTSGVTLTLNIVPALTHQFYSNGKDHIFSFSNDPVKDRMTNTLAI